MYMSLITDEHFRFWRWMLVMSASDKGYVILDCLSLSLSVLDTGWKITRFTGFI